MVTFRSILWPRLLHTAVVSLVSFSPKVVILTEKFSLCYDFFGTSVVKMNLLAKEE